PVPCPDALGWVSSDEPQLATVTPMATAPETKNETTRKRASLCMALAIAPELRPGDKSGRSARPEFRGGALVLGLVVRVLRSLDAHAAAGRDAPRVWRWWRRVRRGDRCRSVRRRLQRGVGGVGAGGCHRGQGDRVGRVVRSRTLRGRVALEALLLGD